MDHIGFKKVFTLGVSYTLEKARGQKNAHQQELSLLRPVAPCSLLTICRLFVQQNSLHTYNFPGPVLLSENMKRS